MDRLFGLTENGTTPRTEVVAGLPPSLTMAYTTVANPEIMAAQGMVPGAAFVATRLAGAIGGAVRGLLPSLPVALAPGVGRNA